MLVDVVHYWIVVLCIPEDTHHTKLLMFVVRLAVLISGKRKSGKNFVCDKIDAALRPKFGIHVSGVSLALKQEFAKLRGLSYEELKGDGPFKEKHRAAMIKWGEKMRDEDSGCFCRCTLPNEGNHVDVLIIFDCRRPSDIEFYRKYAKQIVTLRIECDDAVRIKRGYQFKKGIDDAASECSLDNYAFDFVLDNSKSEDVLEQDLNGIIQHIERILLS